MVETVDILKDIIEDDEASFKKRQMTEGTNYYNGINDILKTDNRKYYVDGYEYTDLEKTNVHIVNNFQKKLVDQKTGYIVGQPITLECEDEELLEKVEITLGEDWHDTLMEWVKGACNKGAQPLHPYIDEKGLFDYVIIPEEQMIYIYDTSYEKTLVQTIRYYPITWVDGDKEVETLRVELWDKEKTTYYQQTQDKGFEFIQPGEMDDVTINPRYHWYTRNTNNKTYDGVELTGIEPHSWGKVPFVKLKNNSEELSDLAPIKTYIDALDMVSSGFVNDLKDLQLAIWVLRGYEGESLAEFATNLKKFKAIKLDNSDSSSAVPETMEIPKEARVALMGWLEEKIYQIGQGVNESKMSGGSLTNVAIKAAYTGLSLKSNLLITKMKSALQDFMYFIVANINDNDGTDYDYKDIGFVFNTSMIFNEIEMITALKDLGVQVSQKTMLANLPFVDDVDKELENLAEEQKAMQDSLGEGMDFEE